MEHIVKASELKEKVNQIANPKYVLTQKDIDLINTIIINGFKKVWEYEPKAKRFKVMEQRDIRWIENLTLADYLYPDNDEKRSQLSNEINQLLKESGYTTYSNEYGLFIKIINQIYGIYV